MLSVLLTIIYMLIGTQIGARVFYWGRRISKDRKDFIIPLVLIVLVWPIFFLGALESPAVRKILKEWDK